MSEKRKEDVAFGDAIELRLVDDAPGGGIVTTWIPAVVTGVFEGDIRVEIEEDGMETTYRVWSTHWRYAKQETVALPQPPKEDGDEHH
jgi:hypothetical protein